MDKQNWNSLKKDLWKQNPSVLMQKLQQLETEKQKFEIYLRANGHLLERQAYQPKFNNKDFKTGNLKELRHRIACIKTMLNVKLKSPNPN